MTDHEDRRGVFVPFWMLRSTSPAEAVYLAQLSWLYQPGYRGLDRSPTVERKGERWLLLRDRDMADELGVSEPTVRRLRGRLRDAGLIATMTAQVDGVRSALVRPLFEALQQSHAQNDGDSRADRAGGHAQIARMDLPIKDKERETTTTANGDAVRRAADRVVTDWWEARKAQGQAPVQSYIAVVKIVDRALRNGVTVNDVARALAGCPTVTAASLEFTLSKLRGRVTAPPPNVSEAAAEQIVADYEHANGPGPRHSTGRALPLEP